MSVRAASEIRELAVRESNGISVRLLWHPCDEAVTVSVEPAPGRVVAAAENYG